MAKISAIIPTMKGREDMLKRLLDSLPEDVEKIVVDDENLLLAAKRNKGARLATGDYFFFVDDDNYLKDFALNEMVGKFTEEIGVMGMTACYHDKKRIVADGGSQRNMLTGFTVGLRTNKTLHHESSFLDDWKDYRPYDVDEVANAFMIPRNVFEESGGFDEENFPIDLDEADLCKRIKDMGYRIVMNPKAICYHKSQTYSHIINFRRPSNAYFLSRNIILFQGKYLNALSYWVFVVVFLPVRLLFYSASLVWRKKFSMIPWVLKGTWDGLRGCRENQFQQK